MITHLLSGWALSGVQISWFSDSSDPPYEFEAMTDNTCAWRMVYMTTWIWCPTHLGTELILVKISDGLHIAKFCGNFDIIYTSNIDMPKLSTPWSSPFSCFLYQLELHSWWEKPMPKVAKIND